MPSSVIRKWSYDEEAERLDVTFVSGRRYSYHDVPAALAQEMKLAFAKGEFFNKRIRGSFRYTEGARAEVSTAGAADVPPARPARPAG